METIFSVSVDWGNEWLLISERKIMSTLRGRASAVESHESDADGTMQSLDRVGISDSDTAAPDNRSIFRRTLIGALESENAPRAEGGFSLDCAGFFDWIRSWSFFDWWKLSLVILVIAFVVSLISAFGPQIQQLFLQILVRLTRSKFTSGDSHFHLAN